MTTPERPRFNPKDPSPNTWTLLGNQAAAVQHFRDEIAHWRGRAEEAEGQLQEATNTNPPPMVAPGVPYMDLVLPTGRQLRLTANFGVFLAIVGYLAEEGVDLETIDQLSGDALATHMVKPGRVEEMIGRAGMALQPDENWGQVIAQLDSATATSLIGWLARAITVGQQELATAAQEDAPGEAPANNPNPSPG